MVTDTDLEEVKIDIKELFDRVNELEYQVIVMNEVIKELSKNG